MSTIKITYKKANATGDAKFDLGRRVLIVSKNLKGYVRAILNKPDGFYYNIEITGMPSKQIKESDLAYA
jgi:hypothetical protein